MSYRDGYRNVERDGFWTLPRALTAIIVLILFCRLITWVSTGADLANYKFWAPKQEAAKRQVFVQTPSYVLGKAQRISDLRLQYEATKDADAKAAFRVAILHEAASVDNSLLPLDEQQFIAQLKEDN